MRKDYMRRTNLPYDHHSWCGYVGMVFHTHSSLWLYDQLCWNMYKY